MFANSKFELGSFYHPFCAVIPATKQILPVFIFDLSVKFLAPPLGGVFLSAFLAPISKYYTYTQTTWRCR
ncbi:hypothetical protein BC355_13735 [Vibrio cholerae]|uniref:Uncharacterized protein n=2 Tax=Vibrio TaxID=662 RepID=A0A395UC46_VIBCL|nr:hypothetical protein [Vibrio cholerae]ORP24110.1 hypothetical protein B7953_05820 [Vibrio paracholerae]EGQ9416678.1 hypothetical protein [Vibrio cholerae]EGR2418393.1 hypothetical protein [Vibrio cholerae]EGR3933252.1 hypothetical protein [Vibrio cholerae]EGR4110681.1 hypothetical protein [Vibrio cholerae]